MLISFQPRLSALLVPALLALLCACDSASEPMPPSAPTGSASPVSSSNAGPSTDDVPTAEALQQMLLRPADVPAGYRQWTPEPQSFASSSAPACSETLHALEDEPTREPGVVQVRTAYAMGKYGPWLQQVLRAYPADAAASVPGNVATALSNCGAYTMTDDYGSEYRMSVRPVQASADRFVARITVATEVFSLTENLIVARLKNLIIVLSHSAAEPPSMTDTERVLIRALDRIGAAR